MKPNPTNLDAETVVLTLNVVERTALVDCVTGLPRTLAEAIRQPFVRRDRIRVSPRDLEFLDGNLSVPSARSVPRETRRILQGIHEQVIDELNLLNARTSSVAIDNGAHTLYKSGLQSKTKPTLNDAYELLGKLRALPLGLRAFKLTAKDKRFLQNCGLPKETLGRINSGNAILNYADVLVILSTRYGFDPGAQAALIADLMDLRRRILEYLDQESRRTVEIHRQRSLKTQQEWRRKSTNQDG